jgi:hypothetical protein
VITLGEKKALLFTTHFCDDDIIAKCSRGSKLPFKYDDFVLWPRFYYCCSRTGQMARIEPHESNLSGYEEFSLHRRDSLDLPSLIPGIFYSFKLSFRLSCHKIEKLMFTGRHET